MKQKSSLRSFLAIAGSSLLAISYAQSQTLANSYLTTLDVSSPTTLFVTPNFPSFLDGPLTGSSDLTITGYFSSASVSAITNPLSFVNNTGNTFTGNIIVDSGALRIAGSPFASNGGFVAGSMTSSNTITINRAGTLHIDDNVGGGYTANRFGSVGSRPAVNLAGGTINLNGLNNASSSVQTFGALTSSSGQGTLNVSVNGTPSTISPTLAFSSLAISSGSLLTFNGNNLGTAATGVARINFTSAPTLTNGILAGARFYSGAAGTSEFVTYGANGVRAFTASDYTDYATDINTATSTQNVRITSTSLAAAPLTADRTVNSLNYSAVGGWAMGGTGPGSPFKLTIVSGMFLKVGNNSDPNISSGILTAGTGSAPIDLNIIVAQNNMTIGGTAVINDNGASGVVTLVKSGDGRTLNLSNNTVNNGYTGGTSVVGGTLTTGSTANRRYLGTGKVTVDGASALTLGAIGATSNSSGADYTATNGAQINIATAAYTSSDTFDIKANSVISGGVGSGTGLNSLDRGIGGGTANITLATNSVIGHNTALTGALNLSTGTIKNLGTSADLYYGLTTDHTSAAGQITIGTGTAFKGISSVSSGAKTWTLGTINVATGTTDVYFQGLPAATAAPTQIVIGNGTTAGSGAIVNLVSASNVNINVLGSVQVSDTDAVFGNTSTGRNVKFVVTEGSTLTIGQATGMGSGTGIATATVKNGGTLAINAAAAINGAVTIEAGGMFTQNQAALTGTGTFTHTNGSILNLTNATSVSGATQALGTVAGTIVRMGVNPTSGTSSGGITQFDDRLNDAAIYQLTTGITFSNAALATDSLLTLNSSGGIGGILTNNLASQSTAAATGRITIGSNGATMAATTNTTLTLGEDSILNGNLTLGSTAIIDGAPKLGAVAVTGAIDLGAATRTISAVAGTGTLTLSGVISNGGLTKDGAGTLLVSNAANTYSGNTTVSAGTLQIAGGGAIANAGLVSIANVAGATFQVTASETIGNLTGGGATGGTVILGTTTLTLGDATNQTYAGTFSGATAGNLVKQGAGVFEMSGANALTGTTAISGGVLKVSGAASLSTGNLNLSGGGVLGLANGNFSRSVGTGVGTAQFTGSGGFAAFGDTRTVQFSGSSINWTATNFIGNGNTLVLGTATADATLDWQQAISTSGGTRTVQVNNGSATVDAIMSGNIAGGTSGTANGFTKTGTGTLAFTSNGNSHWGPTTVSNGNLTVGNGGTTGILSVNTATITVASGATLTVNRSNAVSQAVSGGLGNGAAVISGDGGFTQAGSGSTALTLANTYIGATNVNAGTLLINGSTSSTSLVSVASGATLGGTGTVGGHTTITGIHSPGNSPGVITHGGNLTYEAGASVLWELVANSTASRGTSFDGINVAATLDFNGPTTLGLNFNFGASAVEWSDTFWASSYLGTGGWLVYSGATSLDGFGNLGLNAPALWLDETGDTLASARPDGSFALYQHGNNIYLNYNAVPEPRAALLGGLGMLLLLRRRRA